MSGKFRKPKKRSTRFADVVRNLDMGGNGAHRPKGVGTQRPGEVKSIKFGASNEVGEV